MKEKKYLTIYKSIKEQILCNEYRADEKIPSKRVTADKYGCSVITVETAYNMLADEGYITTKERSGYYVNHIDALSNTTNHAKHTTFDYLDTPIVDYNTYDFEYSLWFKTIRKVISERGQELFIKYPSQRDCRLPLPPS